MIKNLAVVTTLALALAGCANFSGTSPSGVDQTVLIAGDIGAVGCAAFALQGKPSDVALGRMAASQLRNVLAGANPTVAAFGAVCTQAPEKYSALCAVVLDRVVARFGDAGIIKKDGKTFEALKAFSDACSAALG